MSTSVALALALPLVAIVVPAVLVNVGAAVPFGVRVGVWALAAYSAFGEIDMEPLAGARADRLLDVTLGLLALGTAGYALVLAPRLSLSELTSFIGSPTAWLIFFFGSGALLFTVSLAPLGTLQRTAVAVALVTAAALIVHRAGFIHVVAALTVGSAALVVASIGWELFGTGTQVSEITGTFDTGIAGLVRHQGLTSSPNQFGRVSAAVLVGGALLSRGWVYRWHGLAFQAIGALGLFYAQSRTAMIAGVVVFMAVHLRHGRALLVAVMVAAAASVVLWLWSTSVIGVDTFTRDGGGTQELTTATGRTTLWRISLDLALERPLTGVGAFATEEALAPAVADGRISFKAADAHNFVLNTFLAQGLFGLTVLVGFIASAVHRIRARMSVVGSGYLVLLVAGLGLMENLFWKPNSTLLLLGVAAAGLSLIRPQRADDDETLVERQVVLLR